MGALPWFRLYTEMRTDPKMLVLSDAEFRIWINLLCLAGEQNANGVVQMAEGFGFPTEALARSLFTSPEVLTTALDTFSKMDMVSIDANGVVTVAKWKKRQFTSDNSTQRWRKWAQAKAAKEASKTDQRLPNVGSNASPTMPDTDTDTDTDTDKDKELMADVTPSERDILRKAKEIYPAVFSYEHDLKFIRDLAVDYPAIDLHEELCKWQLWLTEHKHPKNWRLAYRNWCKKAYEMACKKGDGRYANRRPTSQRSAYADLLQH